MHLWNNVSGTKSVGARRVGAPKRVGDCSRPLCLRLSHRLFFGRRFAASIGDLINASKFSRGLSNAAVARTSPNSLRRINIRSSSSTDKRAVPTSVRAKARRAPPCSRTIP
jgi:hypothetical protein